MRKKVVLIISEQAWGEMYVSKHHYAIELVKANNIVYFLNPANTNFFGFSNIEISQQSPNKDLFIINHNIKIPLILKFKARIIYQAYIKIHLLNILRKLPKIDLIFSFDLANVYKLAYFNASIKKIFFPVDLAPNNDAINAALGADFIISVAQEIIEQYKQFKVPKLKLNHGVSELFLNQSYNLNQKKLSQKINVGLSGNFLRKDIDRNILLEIITKNKDLNFNFFGPYESKQSNISNNKPDKETVEFIQNLRQKENVVFYGPILPSKLVFLFKNIDIFLICYDVTKDQSKGTNYHKVLEYLATGMVVVSNNISSYKDTVDLVEMVNERNTNFTLPDLFKNVVNNLGFYNSLEMSEKRKEYAKNNSYAIQLEKIFNFINL